MAIHLIRLAVGVDSIDDIRRYQSANATRMGLVDAVPGFTRRRPKRVADLVGGGSLFWVIKSQIRIRQRILDLVEDTDAEGMTYCLMHLHPQIIEVQPTPKRPFQGWRYLQPADAPPDLAVSDDGDPLPSGLAEDLRDLGVY